MNQIVVGKLLMQRMHSGQPIRDQYDNCTRWTDVLLGRYYMLCVALNYIFWNALEGII